MLKYMPVQLRRISDTDVVQNEISHHFWEKNALTSVLQYALTIMQLANFIAGANALWPACPNFGVVRLWVVKLFSCLKF